MARQLIATKMFVPKLRRGLVARPRLLERLHLGSLARVTLVSAPPGFGKTTLLAEWVHSETVDAKRIAWLSLDPSDNDPASFWAYVVGALEAVVPHVSPTVQDLVAAGQVPTELVVTTLLNELAAAPAEEVWLVLDDFHLVVNREVRDGLTLLVEHLPPHVHVLLSTRADPDLPLSRWRVRGELVEIRAADLRFNRDETAEYLRAATGLELGLAEVATLGERTEGWIAALQLAALSLRGRDDTSGFIERFAGDDRYIVDYLMDEVLAHQPEDVRGFLLLTAFLDRLTGPLCDAVTGLDSGTRMLTSLERANLFVVPLDDQGQWFRYHHLFADVLRARLLAEQPEQVPVLHGRASQWFESVGLTDDAIRHALAAEDYDRASHLIEQAVPVARRNRRDTMLIRWLQALPDDAIRRSPVLSVVSGWMLLASGDLAAVESRLDDAESLLARVAPGSPQPWADTEELRTLPATIAVYRASLAQARGDAAGTAEHARHALDLAGPGDHLARGAASGFLGLAAWSDGDVSLALGTFSQAVASLHAAGNLVDELSGTALLADMWMVAGRPSKAREISQRALSVAEALGPAAARATADLHVELAELEVEAGDLEAAQRHLEAAASLAELVSTSESRYRWFVTAGRLASVRGDHERAVTLLSQAEERYVPGFYPNVRPLAAIKARLWVAHGDLVRASDWAAERGVAATDEVRYLGEFDHLTLVRLILAQHSSQPAALDEAVELLGRLRVAAESSGRAGSLLEIGMLRALALLAQGQRAQAVEILARAIAQAPEPDGYVRLFLDEGEPIRGLLREAERQGLAVGHPGRLLAHEAATDGALPAAHQPPSQALADALTERELQVLRLLDSELSGPEIARALFVSPNTLRTHTKHIFTKLDVTTRRAAVVRARDRGLL
ncbi:MAG: LuxR C-terminal-related transcriptional regulator [Propionicimonas sp.]